MVSSLWPIHPHPLPDELLSSWLIRLARGNGFKVHNFCSRFFGRERQIWNRDVDHLAPAWLLDALVERAGTPRDRIAQTTLRAFESYAFEQFNETSVTRWILPLSVYHRTRRAYGQQFCPACLATDHEPYLRRSWRLAQSVVCVTHELLLRDSCASCASPMAPHRSDMNARGGLPEKTDMLRCFKCRSRLDEFSESALAADVTMQRKLDSAIHSGFTELYPGSPLYSPLYFDGLRMIMRAADARGPVRHRRGFEFEPIKERLKLLRAAVDLTEDWPMRFIERCGKLPHAFTSIANKETGPYWVDSVLRQHVVKRRAVISNAEAKAIAEAATRQDPSASLRTLTRRLSGRDIGHMLPPLPPVTDDSADLLIAFLDQGMCKAKPRDRMLLLRDKVIFSAGRCLRLSIPDILALQLSDIGSAIDEEFSFWEPVDTRDRALSMLRWYARTVRPSLALEGTDALFVTAAGAPIKRNGVGMRFSAAVAKAQLSRAIPDWTRWARLARAQ